jgi:hypothetical protein
MLTVLKFKAAELNFLFKVVTLNQIHKTDSCVLIC